MTARRPTPAVTIDTIRAAQKRIAAGIARTPCPHSIPLSELTGFRVWCKLDLLQRTGSFKERGARNALELLDAAARSRGVIAASAGNHALGLAWHGRLLEIPVTVVMPRFAPLVKGHPRRGVVRGRPGQGSGDRGPGRTGTDPRLRRPAGDRGAGDDGPGGACRRP